MAILKKRRGVGCDCLRCRVRSVWSSSPTAFEVGWRIVLVIAGVESAVFRL